MKISPVQDGPVLLRSPAPADRDEFVRLYDAQGDHVTPWMAFAADTPDGRRPATGAERFERAIGQSDDPTACPMMTCVNDAIVGQVNLSNIVRGAFQSCTVGYWIAREHSGRGVMTRALRLAVLVAFGQLGLHRVEANIMPRNGRSIALVRRVGFRHEGLARRYLEIAGVWEDHERWGMTVEDVPLA